MKRVSVKSTVFMLGYLCFLIGYIISASRMVEVYPSLMRLRSAFRAMGYLCCLYQILQIKTKRENVFLIILSFIVVAFSRLITGIDILVVDFFIIVAVQGVNKRKLISLDLAVRIVCLFLLYFTVRIGLVSDYIGYRDGLLIRHSWGFNHPNRLGVHLLAIALDVFYLYHKKFRRRHWAMIVILAAIANYIADSRTAVACILMVILAEIVLIITRKIKDNSKGAKLKAVSYCTLSLCVIVSLLIPYLYNNGRFFIEGGSNTIGSRIIKAAYAIKKFGIPLLGQKIENVTISEAIEKGIIATGIDNLYIHLLVNFGMVLFVLAIGLCFKTISYLVRTKKYPVLICFLIFVVFGLVENTAYVIECNVFLIFIGEAVLDYTREIRHLKHSMRIRGCRIKHRADCLD